MKSRPNWWLWAGMLLAVLPAAAAPRVALMDFSTDDNSYLSAQAAANFSGFLQARLGNEPGVDWVERVQLDKARQELELSAASLINGANAIRRGKWVKADWMISGQFSLDDRNRRTLFLEVTDLQHADVLASSTLTFPDATGAFWQSTNQVETTATTVRQLLSEARLRQTQMADKILVAQLFFSGMGGAGSPWTPEGAGALEKGFLDALERAAATNGRVRLIRFPRAYRALEESEMALDGLVEADHDALNQIADLYVWGTMAPKAVRIQGQPPETKLGIELQLWDGVSPPLVVQEELPTAFPGIVPAEQAAAAMNRLAVKVMDSARKRTVPADAGGIRHEIAQSIIKSSGAESQFGPMDQAGITQLAHMLETACFFDPDDAKARALYLNCRWGDWMNFRSNLKNEFWSKWRRSQAWGKYGNRFGLKPVALESPLPFRRDAGVLLAYLRSLDEVAAMLPQWNSAEEIALDEQWRRQGVHSPLMEAEFHGFPKEMPPDLIMKWKAEIQAEHWKRLGDVAAAVSAGLMPDEKTPSSLLTIVIGEILKANQSPQVRLALLEKIWPECVKYAQAHDPRWVVGNGSIAQEHEKLLVDLCAQAGQPAEAGRLLALLPQVQVPTTPSPACTNPGPATAARRAASHLVPIPPWAANFQSYSSMFRLSPPESLPLEVKPKLREIQFPKQFEVQTVEQLGFLGDALLILAMDERSAPSSDNRPDVSAEMLDKHKRLWLLKAGTETPALYEADLFRQSINAFLLAGDQLWVAGKTTGSLNLKTRQFHKFGLEDGFDLPTAAALGFGGGHVFAVGDNFELCEFDAGPSRWQNLPLPRARLSSGTGWRFLLAGNQRQLAYVAGSILIHDLMAHTWTNPPNEDSLQAIQAVASGFWFGGQNGLYFHDSAAGSFQHWSAPPASIGSGIYVQGFSVMGSIGVYSSELERMDKQIQDSVKRVQEERVKQHALKRAGKAAADPLHLDWRVPGGVTAMAADGDRLWIGADRYLFLFHPADNRLVAYCRMPERCGIGSLAVSASSVWVGAAWGDHNLIEIPKSAFLSVPPGRWMPLAISAADRGRILRDMNVRDQAVYGFHAGDDARVAALLEAAPPEKASLEELFLLGFCYDIAGLDKPELTRKWFGQIVTRFPDSPWSKAAKSLLAENDRLRGEKAGLLATYDLNHDGVLDAAERARMTADPAYQQERAQFASRQLDGQLAEIIKDYDRDGDGKLNGPELNYIRLQVLRTVDAAPENTTRLRILLAPMLTRHFPLVADMLKQYDANGDGALDLAELKKLSLSLQKDQ